MSALKTTTDHIVTGDGGFHCLYCGAKYMPTLPCSVNVFCSISKAFIKDHRYCKKPVEVTENNIATAVRSLAAMASEIVDL